MYKSIKKTNRNLAWQCTPVIPVYWDYRRQEDCKFQSSLGTLATEQDPVLKGKIKKELGM